MSKKKVKKRLKKKCVPSPSKLCLCDFPTRSKYTTLQNAIKEYAHGHNRYTENESKAATTVFRFVVDFIREREREREKKKFSEREDVTLWLF